MPMPKLYQPKLPHIWRCTMFTLLFFAGVTQCMLASVTASLTISGTEQYSASAGVWDVGTVTVTINGYPETVPYGQYSTPSSIAAAVAAKFSQDCNAPSNARSNGSLILFRGKGTVASLTPGLSATGDTTHFPQNSFADSNPTNSTDPTVTGLSLNTGPEQMGFVITGANFGSSPGAVTIGDKAATIVSWSATSITVQVPAGAVTGNVVVTVTGHPPSNGWVFTVSPAFGCGT